MKEPAITSEKNNNISLGKVSFLSIVKNSLKDENFHYISVIFDRLFLLKHLNFKMSESVATLL